MMYKCSYFNNEEIVLNIDEPNGVYFMEIVTGTNKEIVKVVKK